jgi:hypothetical protein
MVSDHLFLQNLWQNLPSIIPDVNVIFFLEKGTTNYKQSGKYILGGFDPPVNFAENYKQDGSRITFSGVNPIVTPNRITSVPYYGVLSSDEKILHVDAYELSTARITTSISTFPKGTSPSLIRQ